MLTSGPSCGWGTTSVFDEVCNFCCYWGSCNSTVLMVCQGAWNLTNNALYNENLQGTLFRQKGIQHNTQKLPALLRQIRRCWRGKVRGEKCFFVCLFGFICLCVFCNFLKLKLLFVFLFILYFGSISSLIFIYFYYLLVFLSLGGTTRVMGRCGGTGRWEYLRCMM